MVRRRAGWLLLVTLAAAAATADGQEPAAECPELRCESFLEEALDKDPEFKAALQTYLQARYRELSARAVAAWTLGAAAGYDHMESISGSDFEPETVDRRRYEVSLEHLFLATGTRFRLSHTNSLSRLHFAFPPTAPGIGIGNFIDLSPNVSLPAVTLALSQPLLRNAFGLAERFPLRSAQLQAEAAWLDASEAWENRLVELYNAYLDWAGAYETLAALREIADDMAEVMAWVERRAAAGVANRLDLLETRASLLQARARVAQAESAYAGESERLAGLRLAAVRPQPEQRPCLEAALENCLSPASPEAEVDVDGLRNVRRLALLEEQAQERIRVAGNARLPELELTGSLTRKGRAEDESGGYNDLNRNDYAIGLRASYPLGAPQASGELGQARAAGEEIRQTLIATRRDMRLAVRRLADSVRSLQSVLALRNRQAEAAQARLAESRRRFNTGQLDTVFLIQAENDLINAQLLRIQALIQLKSQWVAWLAAADRLLNRHHGLEQRLRAGREAAR